MREWFVGVLCVVALATTTVLLGQEAGRDPHADLAHAAGLKGTLVDFADFTPGGSQPGLDFALEGASSCNGCHGGAIDETHYPANSWQGSMMANATRDPLFWAALDVANADGASIGAEGIGDFCLRCHTPGGWFAGRVRKASAPIGDKGELPPGDLVDGTDGCLLQGGPEAGDVSNNDWRGIDCHFCHRMLPGEGPHGVGPGNGAVTLDDSDCGGQGEPCRHGPYAYPEPLPMGGSFSPPHPWEQSHFLGSAAACGSCHDVTSPTVDGSPLRSLRDATGNDTGIPFPIERTYSEWRASDHAVVVFSDGAEQPDVRRDAFALRRGRDCGDCHMPQAEPLPGQDEVLACFFGPDRLGELPTHEFAGGNHWVPQLIKNEFPALGRADALDWSAARAEAMLQERSALVAVDATVSADAQTLEVEVEVVNLAGHKLPTGYAEGRRIWLALQVRDANDQLLWEDGAWNPADGALQHGPQTRIYEVHHGIWDAGAQTCRITDGMGREQFHFVLNDCIAHDTRIPPAGFTGGADPELAPVGRSFEADGAGRLLPADRAPYTVPLPPGTAFPVQVNATLRFQIASREYIEFLRDQAVERGFPAENDLCSGGPGRPFSVGAQSRSRGQYMYELWESYGRSPPVDMASDSTSAAPASP